MKGLKLCVACWFGECGAERSDHLAPDADCVCCQLNEKVSRCG